MRRPAREARIAYGFQATFRVNLRHPRYVERAQTKNVTGIYRLPLSRPSAERRTMIKVRIEVALPFAVRRNFEGLTFVTAHEELNDCWSCRLGDELSSRDTSSTK